MIAVARAAFPGWQAHPDVWLIVGLIAATYFIALRRLGPKLVAAGEVIATRRHLVCFTLGLLALWIPSDYPIHDLSERYLYSVHMVQHLMFSMIAAPLLLLGTPAWLAREALARTRTLGLVRRLSKFVLVVAWYMHLKTDNKILRRLFIMGLVGALVLFTIIMLTLHAMQNSYHLKNG